MARVFAVPNASETRSSVRVPRVLASMALAAFIGSVAVAEGPRVTDDPQGRVFIPLEESLDPVGNVAEEGGSYDPGSSLEATAREKVLQIESASSPLVIPAAAFTADGSNPDSMFFPFSGGYFQGDTENYGCMVAPAYLPQGAEITDMFASVYDDDAVFNLSVTLRRVDNFAGGAQSPWRTRQPPASLPVSRSSTISPSTNRS